MKNRPASRGGPPGGFGAGGVWRRIRGSVANRTGAWCFLLLLALLPLRARALNPAKSVYQYNCRSWARQNGLPANAVYAISQAEDGYLWLGSSRGLVRFDGQDFKLIDLALVPETRSTIVTCIANTRRGLWFGLERGSFGFFDGRNTTLFGRDEWGGRSLLVQSILETGSGDVWVGAEGFAGRLTGTNRWETLLSGPGSERCNITAMHEDSHGRIWLGTAQRGLYFWWKATLTKFPDARLDEFNLQSVLVDRKGRIWVGTEWGLFCYDAEFNRQPFPHPWYQTRALLEDREGVLWAGTSGGGLCRILDGNLTQIRKADGLADDFVTALVEDREGSLWVGTRNGLSQISDVKIPTFGKKEGLTADVNVGVYPSRRGGLWVATGEGFTYFDGTPHPYGTNLGLRNSYILGMLEDRTGDLYLITGGKDVEVFAGGRVVATYANKTWPSAMAEDAQGVVVAVAGELYRAGTNRFSPYRFATGQKPPLNWIHGMASARDGGLWIAGDVGICRVKDENSRTWSQPEGLPNTKVLWVCEDDEGVVWAGLETGLARLKNDKISVITKADGLFDNINYTIVPDGFGSLWVDSSRGFYSVSRQSLNDFADQKSRRVQCAGYDGLDAIKSSEKYQQQRSGCRTADGRIWFPTAEGIAMIDPANLGGNPVPPSVHLHELLANGRQQDAASAVVPPGRGDLEFHYAGLSFIAPSKTQYRYRLHGYDSDWVDAGTRRAAFYTNLKPGRYEFEVQACNEDGVWSKAGARCRVTLRPRFYQSPWFYALGILAAAAVLAVGYRSRVRNLRLHQEALQRSRDQLEARVTERTAELAESNESLVQEVEQRIRIQEELLQRKLALEKEIEERKRIETEKSLMHQELVEASHRAGQAEVASSVLHNVGNVLNSVNVSTEMLAERLRAMQLNILPRVASLIKDHAHDLEHFFTTNEKGRRLPQYLEDFSEHLSGERDELLREINELSDNVSHIKEIVAMQQSYAKAAGLQETLPAVEIVENGLRIDEAAYERDHIRVVRQFEEVPPLNVERHKVLQILVNVLRNARKACAEGGRPDRCVTISIQRAPGDKVRIGVADNGIGIPPENLTRIFSHGFTTRKNGHGFGLHSSALAAKEMGGALIAQSDGPGQGATFWLDLPLQGKAEG